LTTPPDETEVLKDFYKRVRPWGFWGPIRKLVQMDDPTFQPNPDFLRDMFNIVIGIAWQTSLVAFPDLYCDSAVQQRGHRLRDRDSDLAGPEFTWYDHSEKDRGRDAAKRRGAPGRCDRQFGAGTPA